MYKIKVLRVTGLKMVKGAYSFSSELRLSATGYGIRYKTYFGMVRVIRH